MNVDGAGGDMNVEGARGDVDAARAATGLPAFLLGSKKRKCELILDAGPQNAIGAVMGRAGGDALKRTKLLSNLILH
jgi:hypothetical protein